MILCVTMRPADSSSRPVEDLSTENVDKSVHKVRRSAVLLAFVGWLKNRQSVSIAILFFCQLFLTEFLVAAPLTFSDAKRVMYQHIVNPNMQEFYCGCPIERRFGRFAPDLQSCQYAVRNDPNRASRLEAEHIVPAWEFGHQRQCWQQGGRSFCAKTDPLFAEMEGDLHNIRLAIGEVNRDRSNYPFGMVGNGAQGYGPQCGSFVDFKARRFMPRYAVRGDVARAYLYMSGRYGLRLSDERKKLFAAWMVVDPVSPDECHWARLVYRHTGKRNGVVQDACGG